MNGSPTHPHLEAPGMPLDARPRGQQWWLLALAGFVLSAVPMLLYTTRVLDAAVMWPRWVAMLALAWWLPGLLLVALWRLPDLDAPTGGVLALALGWCWLVLGVLIAHWWPGPISLTALTAVYWVGALALSGLVLKRPARPWTPTPRTRWRWLAALVILAGVLRLPGLGYHEFHYDEVLVLTRAREAIRGEDDAFARHTKGPGELAAATVILRTLETADERTTRLPFGLLSVGAVVTVALLGLRLFGEGTGFWSGVLLAANGFALGLSRIVQYQAAILLLMALAVLAAWEFARRGQLRWLALALILSGFGTVMHYEFVLIGPALLWLIWLGWPKAAETAAPGARWRVLLGTAGASGALVAATYLPAYFNPFFSTTQSYLGSRLGGLGRTANFAFFGEMGTFYNSIYFFGGLIALAGVGLWLARRQQAQAILLLLWFLPYLLLYLFVIEFPGTHWYIFMPAWSLAAAVPLAAWTGPARRRAVRWSAGIAAVLWLAISVNYLHLMFFRQDPEYLINYAEERQPFYWAPYGINVPEKPRFGFPIWEGWKTLGVLSEWKYLNGTYASNERSRHLRWYLGDFERVEPGAQPDFFFVADHLQEAEPGFRDELLGEYTQIGEVTVRDEPRIAVWSRQTLPAPFVRYRAEEFDAIFMGQAPSFDEWPDPVPTVEDRALGETMTLLQGGIAPHRLDPGDLLNVQLVWQPTATPATDYKLFVHVAGPDQVPVAQWDGYPQLNTARTSTWVADQPVSDRVLLPIPDDMPPGDYVVRIGLYDPATGERLGGVAIDVGPVTVR